MGITTTVTWADLKRNYTDELDELRDAYDEITEQATDEYDADALDKSLPENPDLLKDDERDLWVYQQQLAQYDQAAQTLQSHLHLLERLEDDFGGDGFELKMLTGDETMDVETELRMLAADRDVDVGTIEQRRNVLVVDAALVDAPEDFPRDDDGSPVASECPNVLTLALWEQAQQFNSAGETGFSAPGFGTHAEPGGPDAPSATPDTSASASPDSDE